MTTYHNRRNNPRYSWPAAPKPGPFYRKEPPMTYTLMQHHTSGELYGLKAVGGEPYAACGPLHPRDVQHYGDLEMLEYDVEDVASGWWAEQGWREVTDRQLSAMLP